MVFEAVQVLVPLRASLALERLFLLHAEHARVRRQSGGVDDGEGAIGVFVQLLRIVAVLGRKSTSAKSAGRGGLLLMGYYLPICDT